MALELRFLDSIDDAGKAELATLYRLVGWIGPEDGDDFLRGVSPGLCSLAPHLTGSALSVAAG